MIFNKTVRGYSHILKDTECEDSSLIYVDKNDLYKILVVADGHGDSACFRSGRGSKMVAEVALEMLKKCAETYLDISDISDEVIESYTVDNKKIKKHLNDQEIRHLSDTIIGKWNEVVKEDLEKDAIREDELVGCREYTNHYMCGRYLNHIYGTTLIAALFIGDYILFLHQGDGRCEVFFEDGRVEQPVPWDDRCIANATTSMCDGDVRESVRHYVINIKENPVIACFLCSDGVEDSYKNNDDQEGTHTFFRELIDKICTMNEDEFEQYLDEYLPVFSEKGSLDDVSIAGYIEKDKFEKYLDIYKNLNEAYYLNEDLYICENKINSQKRKHEFLKRKYEEAQLDADTKYNRLIDADRSIKASNKRKEEILIEIKDAEEELEDIGASEQEYNSNLRHVIAKLFKRIWPSFEVEIDERIEGSKLFAKRKIQGLKNELELLDENKDKTVILKETLSVEYEKANQDLTKAKETFEEYDINCKAVKEKYQAVLSKIEELKKTSVD